MPLTTSPVNFLLTWGSVNRFRPKFINSWVNLCLHPEHLFGPKLLYLHTSVCTDAYDTFSSLDIASRDQTCFWNKIFDTNCEMSYHYFSLIYFLLLTYFKILMSCLYIFQKAVTLCAVLNIKTMVMRLYL